MPRSHEVKLRVPIGMWRYIKKRIAAKKASGQRWSAQKEILAAYVARMQRDGAVNKPEDVWGTEEEINE